MHPDGMCNLVGCEVCGGPRQDQPHPTAAHGFAFCGDSACETCKFFNWNASHPRAGVVAGVDPASPDGDYLVVQIFQDNGDGSQEAIPIDSLPQALRNQLAEQIAAQVEDAPPELIAHLRGPDAEVDYDAMYARDPETILRRIQKWDLPAPNAMRRVGNEKEVLLPLHMWEAIDAQFTTGKMISQEMRAQSDLLSRTGNVLAKIPHCPHHGPSCLPYKARWVQERSQTVAYGAKLEELQRQADADSEIIKKLQRQVDNYRSVEYRAGTGKIEDTVTGLQATIADLNTKLDDARQRELKLMAEIKSQAEALAFGACRVRDLEDEISYLRDRDDRWTKELQTNTETIAGLQRRVQRQDALIELVMGFLPQEMDGLQLHVAMIKARA